MAPFPIFIDKSYHHLVDILEPIIISQILQPIRRRDIAMRNKGREDFFSERGGVFFEPTKDQPRISDILTMTSREGL